MPMKEVTLKLIAPVLLCLPLQLAAQDQAARSPVVVELFTSQGCSSCPPADDLLRQLATREGVIALALHVDYWDYIGWEDTFAQPGFTARQHRYAMQAAESSVYTPQIIIGGVDAVVGAKPMQVMDLIAAHGRMDSGIDVSLTEVPGGYVIEARSRLTLETPVVVQLVRYLPLESVEITRGENAGRRIDYANIVTSWQALATWDGSSPLHIEAAAETGGPAAVIVQVDGPGAILAAAALP